MKKTLGIGMMVLLVFATPVWAKIGGGDVTFTMDGADPVVFTHERHVTKAGLKCTECHYRIYPASAKHTRATMAEMQQGKSCGACHNGQKTFDVKANCEKCHKR